MSKKTQLFVTVFRTNHLVKPDLPAELIFLTSTLLMGNLGGDAGRIS